MPYFQCPCSWQSPSTGRCDCGHDGEHHDAGQCWANALDCPDCGSTRWRHAVWGGIEVMHCLTCGHWQPAIGHQLYPPKG